jgi:hypothetical protein
MTFFGLFFFESITKEECTQCKKKPHKRYTVCSKQKKWNVLAMWKVWSAPSYPEMFQGKPNENIILGEYLHSIHYSEKLKKKNKKKKQ